MLFSVCSQQSNTLRTNYASYGNMNCSWTLAASKGNIVVLEISSLNFTKCPATCGCGQIDVYDSSSVSQTKIGSWCSTPKKNIVSQGNSMLVNLVTNPTSSEHDFSATYKYIKDLQGNDICMFLP